MLRHLFLGFMRVHILHHAAEGPVYGVALMTELGRHGYQIGPSTIYPLLHRLERQGLLRSTPRKLAGKIRKYYDITPAGRRTLARAQRQLRELVDEALTPVERAARSRGGRSAGPQRHGKEGRGSDRND